MPVEPLTLMQVLYSTIDKLWWENTGALNLVEQQSLAELMKDLRESMTANNIEVPEMISDRIYRENEIKDIQV